MTKGVPQFFVLAASHHRIRLRARAGPKRGATTQPGYRRFSERPLPAIAHAHRRPAAISCRCAIRMAAGTLQGPFGSYGLFVLDSESSAPAEDWGIDIYENFRHRCRAASGRIFRGGARACSANSGAAAATNRARAAGGGQWTGRANWGFAARRAHEPRHLIAATQ